MGKQVVQTTPKQVVRTVPKQVVQTTPKQVVQTTPKQVVQTVPRQVVQTTQTVTAPKQVTQKVTPQVIQKAQIPKQQAAGQAPQRQRSIPTTIDWEKLLAGGFLTGGNSGTASGTSLGEALVAESG